MPPGRLLPARPTRVAPYIYTAEEIRALLEAAGMLKPELRAETFRTLIGLMAATGIRTGEAIGLDIASLDQDAHTLTVTGKYGKIRMLPLHPTVVDALTDYLRQRDRLLPAATCPALLISSNGARLRPSTVHPTFRGLTRQAGLKPVSSSCRPRLHDLRHTFAVSTMLDAYRSGDDPAAVLPVLSTWLGHTEPRDTYWYLTGTAELLAAATARLETRRAHATNEARIMTPLAPILQAFFTTRLTDQYGASPHTVAAYRDTWRLLLRYAEQHDPDRTGRLDLSQLDSNLISGFLAHLETERGNSVTTRNARLAAVHSLFSYAAYHHPEHAATISRVLAIPAKRAHRTDITYLDPSEVTALLAAPDRTTPAGRRDHALIQVAVTTGMRVSELTGLQIGDVHLGTAAARRLPRKGPQGPHHTP